MILVSESPDECVFQLDSGIRFRVSPEDKMFVVGRKWHLSADAYIACGSPPLVKRYLHDLIAERAGHQASPVTDHEDRDPLNDRRDNLRPATHHQNQLNRKGMNGICWSHACGKWRAYISGKHLGVFDTIEQAVKARAAHENHK